MKHLALFILFLPALLAAQTCDYDKLFREGKTFAKQRQYKKALYKFNSARRCDPTKGETVDAAIEALLDQVEGEKKAADKERERAEQALAANEKIINSFYFYADRFALAFNDDKYGFIDKGGNTVIDYKYDEAIPFDETGYAKVKTGGHYYLIDTIGLEYPLATEINQLNGYITALDLRNKNLDSIPAIVFSQSQLKILWLSSNHLLSLPDQIGTLKNLESLELGGNRLDELPKQISMLKNLRSLNLSVLSSDERKKIINLAESFVAQPNSFSGNLPDSSNVNTDFSSLFGWKNQLSTLPSEIGALEKLEALNLADMQLGFIPPEIFQIKSLRSLNLANNQITQLPADINKLIELKSLILGGNELTYLPDEIGALKNLLWLSLLDNHLTTLPPVVGTLTKLKRLSIANNNLVILPKELGRLKNLEWLSMAMYNNFTFEASRFVNNLEPLTIDSLKIDNTLGNIKGLGYSNILKSNTNQLTSLPTELERLKKLQYLDVSGHKLTTLPAGIRKLKKLREIDISNNAFTSQYITQLINAMPWCGISF